MPPALVFPSPITLPDKEIAYGKSSDQMTLKTWTSTLKKSTSPLVFCGQI